MNRRDFTNGLIIGSMLNDESHKAKKSVDTTNNGQYLLGLITGLTIVCYIISLF